MVAVDWSGRRTDAGRWIWTAEVVDGQLVRLETGRSRDEVARDEIARAADGSEVIIGFDFAFSFPRWFVRQQRFGTVHDLWRAEELHEQWLATCPPPFWGRPGRRRPHLGRRPHHRRTEHATEARFGVRPKSVFQIGGAGSVGTGSLRGFPVLARLRRHGFSVWPFDPPAPRTVIELWPRLFTGRVVKSDPRARARHLAAAGLRLRPQHRQAMERCEDAFDAGLSALGMWAHRGELTALRRAADTLGRTEGEIWLPSTDGPLSVL